MGWGFKLALIVLALVIAGLGGLPISLFIFACLILPTLVRLWRGSSSGYLGRLTRRGISAVQVLGVILLLLCAFAVASHGTLSPFLLGSAGVLALLGPRLLSGALARVKPVEDSVLLRGALLPFRWFLLAEAKVSTRDPEGALSGMKERLLLLSTPAPRILLVLSTASLSRSQAEDELLLRAQAAAKALRHLGVYLLPLDGREALKLTEVQAARLDVPSESTSRFLASEGYVALQVEAQHGFVTRFEAYQRREGRTRSLLGEPGRRPEGEVLLRELLQSARQKLGTPQPDSYVAFLSSMAATEGETLGQRITQTTCAPSGQLQVASLGSPQVELTGSQLRAVATIYE